MPAQDRCIGETLSLLRRESGHRRAHRHAGDPRRSLSSAPDQHDRERARVRAAATGHRHRHQYFRRTARARRAASVRDRAQQHRDDHQPRGIAERDHRSRKSTARSAAGDARGGVPVRRPAAGHADVSRRAGRSRTGRWRTGAPACPGAGTGATSATSMTGLLILIASLIVIGWLVAYMRAQKPVSATHPLNQAESLKLAGKFEEAIDVYRRLDDPAAKEGIALCLAHLGRDLDEAQRLMEWMIGNHPQIQEFQALGLAYILLRKGERAAALRLYEDNLVLLETRFRDDYTDPDPLLAETLWMYAALADASGDAARAQMLRGRAAGGAPGGVWGGRGGGRAAGGRGVSPGGGGGAGARGTGGRRGGPHPAEWRPSPGL